MTVHSVWWRRGAAVLVTAALGVVLWPDPGWAHGGVLLTVHGDGLGSVWVTTTWEDGHPVTEPVAATLIATSADGRRVGPAPLAALPGQPGGVRYSGTLAAGVWTVVAEAAAPGLGRCQAVLTVVASAAPGSPPQAQSVRCGEVRSAAASLVDGDTGPPWGVFALAGVVVLAVLAVVYLLLRRS